MCGQLAIWSAGLELEYMETVQKETLNPAGRAWQALPKPRDDCALCLNNASYKQLASMILPYEIIATGSACCGLEWLGSFFFKLKTQQTLGKALQYMVLET